MAVITMGGLAGGGARSLGPIVAQRLGADYVDRLILSDVARRVGATVEALHQREERPPSRGERASRLLQRILERSAVTGAGGDPYFGPSVAAFLTEEYEDLPQPTITKGHELEDEAYIEGVRSATKEVASNGNVVMVGRGAHLILENTPGVLRVGVVARLENRVHTIMEREHLSQEQAKKTIEARDKARLYYFNRFFDVSDPENPIHYHLVVNMSEMSLEHAADIVVSSCAALEDGRLTAEAAVVG